MSNLDTTKTPEINPGARDLILPKHPRWTPELAGSKQLMLRIRHPFLTHMVKSAKHRVCNKGNDKST